MADDQKQTQIFSFLNIKLTSKKECINADHKHLEDPIRFKIVYIYKLFKLSNDRTDHVKLLLSIWLLDTHLLPIYFFSQ